MSSRREFLAGSAAVGAGVALGGLSGCTSDVPPSAASAVAAGPYATVEPADRPLSILILGGTRFLGPAEVEYAQARGHSITLFNRGQTNPEMFPGVEKLVGNRDREELDLSALRGREWDAVIDNSANVATWVEDTASLLQNTAGRYLFVSSISAHSDNSTPGQDEDGPVFSEADYEEVIASDAGQGAAFGPNKAQAERITLSTFGDRGLVVRPGLIVGPLDGSDRFTYWPVRIDRGGEVLAPHDGTQQAQIIDVRDLGRFLIHLLEQEASGTYNALGPASPMSMAEMLYGIRAVTTADVKFTWVDWDFLQEHEVAPWSEMPIWMAPGPEMAGFLTRDPAKAVAAGLTFRPLADTALDTLQWWKAGPGQERELRWGIAADKEAAVLTAWHARSG